MRLAVAFVPDQAIERSHEINQSAFRLYCFYCKRRNKVKRTCYPSLQEAATTLKMAYSYVSEMRHQLIEKNWIRLDGSVITPLVGFGKTEPRTSEKPKNGYGKSEDAGSAKPKSVSGIPNSDSEKPKTHIRKNQPNRTSPIEPDPSGAAPSAQPYRANIIWDIGREMLIECGLTDGNARSLLGKLLKDHGKENLAKAIASTMSANPVNPQQYLLKVLQNEHTRGDIAKAKRDVGANRESSAMTPVADVIEEEQVHWTTEEYIAWVNQHEKEQEQANLRAPEPE